jgi:hypothetical protein
MSDPRDGSQLVDLEGEFADERARSPSDAELSGVASLVELLVQLDRQVEEVEDRLKRLKARRRQVSEHHLPVAMDSCGERGVTSWTLGSGERVVLSTKYRCGQLDDSPDDPKKPDAKPAGQRLEALKWLEQSGHGDLVRRTIVITLGKDSTEAERQIVQHFDSLRLNSGRITSSNVVPWNTLSGFVSDLEAKIQATGDLDELPLDLLGVSKVRVAEVKKPKAGDQLS